MSTVDSEKLKGIWGSIQLPFNSDESIDYSALETEIGILAKSGIRGIYSNGTAAEFFNQTEFEFDRINEMMANICNKYKKLFQIGVSHMSPILSIERIKRTKGLNPVAFQVILPDWLPLNFDESISFLDKIIGVADPIPVVLYNPGHAKTKLTPPDIKALFEKCPQLVGIKLSAGGSQWYNEMREINPDSLIFIQGHRLATGINEKVASGSYSNIACLDPIAAQKWYEIILEDIEEGLKIEKKIIQFFDHCILPFAKQGYSDAALDKFLWAISGRKSTDTKLRWPYVSIDRSHLIESRNVAKKILPDFFNL